jgi:hypothetical protein
LAIVTQNKRLAGVGAKQVEQYADRCRLARAVQPEEPKYLALIGFEMEIVHSYEVAVAFCQALQRNS